MRVIVNYYRALILHYIALRDPQMRTRRPLYDIGILNLVRLCKPAYIRGKEIDHNAADLVDDTPWHFYDTNSIRDITAFAFLACFPQERYIFGRTSKLSVCYSAICT